MSQVLHVEIIGYIGSFMLSLMAIPQIVSVYKTKSAADLSYGMMAMLMIGYTFFLTYGVLIMSIPIIASVSLSVVNCLVLIGLKHKYGSASKDIDFESGK